MMGYPLAESGGARLEGAAHNPRQPQTDSKHLYAAESNNSSSEVSATPSLTSELASCSSATSSWFAN